MRHASKLAASLFALAVMIGFAGTASAADADKKSGPKGSIAGTVKGPDGMPVVGATVRLMSAADAPNKKGKGKGKGEDKGAAAQADKGADKGAGKKGRPAAIMETTTEAGGKFTMKDVPAGEYRLMANMRGTGNGTTMVTVMAGMEAMADITLKAPKAK